MKVIERDRDKLVLHNSTIWVSWLFAVTFIPGGIFIFLLGWAIYLSKLSSLIVASIMPIIMGSGFILGGIYFAIMFAEVKTYTFNKVTDSFSLKKQTLRQKFQPTSLECPLHLIFGVEVTESNAPANTQSSYYPCLILNWIYWRIPLTDNGSEGSAANFAKIISEFLNIPYFTYNSKVPIQIFDQKIEENRPPEQYSWQYLNDFVDRLKQELERDPNNPDTQLELGVMLYYLNQSKAIAYLKQAEKLYESKQERDRAAITRVLQNWIHMKRF